MKTLTLMAMLLVGCGVTTSTQLEDPTAPVVVEPQVVTQLRATLATWPTCTTETTQVWSVQPKWCTRKFCGPGICCNTCSWQLVADTTLTPSVLGLPSSGLDCEQVALSEYLTTVLIDPTAHCVVR